MSDTLGQRFERAAERVPFTKPFAYESEQVAGKSNGALLRKHQKYAEADALQQACMMYALSYSQTMMIRVLEEQPDFFEEKDMNKTEFLAHLQNNMCLGVTKYRNSVFKSTSASIQDEGYTNDKIRRLVNGGDKFHPYL